MASRQLCWYCQAIRSFAGKSGPLLLHPAQTIDMLVQHYGAGTTLAKKMTALIEALQLEIGCIGSPFVENYEELQLLATSGWTKSLWERLHYYRF